MVAELIRLCIFVQNIITKTKHMKILLTHSGILNRKNLVEVKNWNAFADLIIAYQHKDDPSKYPLAETVEAMMEITSSDHDIPYDTLQWSDYTANVADSIFHCNAPHIFNGSLKQITSFPDVVYTYTEKLVIQECKAYFDKEEFIQLEEVKANKGNTSSKKVKAQYPGVYASPTKVNPLRAIAYYRKDSRTIKLGTYDNIQLAIQAKKDHLNIS